MSNHSDTLRTLPERAFRARAGLVAGAFCLILPRAGGAAAVFAGGGRRPVRPARPRPAAAGHRRSRRPGPASAAPTASFSRPTAAAGTLRASPRETPAKTALPLPPSAFPTFRRSTRPSLLEQFGDRCAPTTASASAARVDASMMPPIAVRVLRRGQRHHRHPHPAGLQALVSWSRRSSSASVLGLHQLLDNAAGVSGLGAASTTACSPARTAWC